MSVNRVTLVGRLGNDPDLRQTPSGTSVATFSIATNERWNDRKGERQERVTWHRIVAWNKLAETCGEFLKKGRQVYVEGRIQYRDWMDKENNKRTTTEIVVTNVTFLGSSNRNQNDQVSEASLPAVDDEPAPF